MSVDGVERGFGGSAQFCSRNGTGGDPNCTALSLHFWLALQTRPVSFGPNSDIRRLWTDVRCGRKRDVQGGFAPRL